MDTTELRPPKIRLEAASICQLKCPLCPTAGRRLGVVGSGLLDPEAFDRLLEANPWIREIELSNWGEIALHPGLPRLIERAFRAGVDLTAGNGVNFNKASDELLEAMVKYRFRSLNCSIDGATPQTYRIYRRGGDLEKVLENLRRLNALKAKHESPYPILEWQFIVFPHNEHEIEAARRLAGELGMRFHLKPNWDTSPRASRHTRRFLQSRGAEARDGSGELCAQLWNQPQINWDGKMLGCCVNTWGDFGNAFREGLLPVLNGEKMRYARGMLTGALPPRADIPCAKCHQYRSLRAKNTWLRVSPEGWSWFSPAETLGRRAARLARTWAWKGGFSFRERVLRPLRSFTT